MQFTELSKITTQILFEQLQLILPEICKIEDLTNWALAGPYMEKYNIYPAFSGFDEGGECAYLAQLPKIVTINNIETRLQCAARHPVLAFWTCFLAYHKGVIKDHYSIYIQVGPEKFVYT